MITKLLCKYFDVEEKGYVTLGDVASPVIGVAILIIIGAAVAFFIGGAYLHGAWLLYSGAPISEDGNPAGEMACVLIFIIVSVLIVVWIATYLASKLAPIRIATCERKDGDE